MSVNARPGELTQLPEDVHVVPLPRRVALMRLAILPNCAVHAAKAADRTR